MSILLWTLLVWFVPGLIAGACLLLLTMRDRRAAMTPCSSRSVGKQAENTEPLVHERAAAESELPTGGARCRQVATTLVDPTNAAFMLRIATTFEQLDEERRASPQRTHPAPATASGQHRR
jgi:hypothetical protein